jgi:hypothetical protein
VSGERWLTALHALESAKAPGAGTDKADKRPSVGSVSAPPGYFSKITATPILSAGPPTDPLAAAALARLVIDDVMRRAVVAKPDDAAGYRLGVAVRMPAGGYATAVLTVPINDGFAILAALQRACDA